MISIKALAAIVAVSVASAAIAGPMVIRASGPSAANFRPGTRLASDSAVALKAGDLLVVLDAQGTRSLQGPGSFRFDQAPAAQGSAVLAYASLLTQKTERRARIGAVRGVAPPADLIPQPPGVWAIDASTSATVCVLDPAQVAIWRRDPMAAQTLTLTRSSDARTATIAFAAGQSLAEWPGALAPATAAKYVVSGGGAPVTLTVKPIAAPESVDQLGTLLFDNQCQSQLDRLATLTASKAD